eukprot:COSAG01_NODE_11198_length_1983_cov_21.563163_1_plen_217_part_00
MVVVLLRGRHRHRLRRRRCLRATTWRDHRISAGCTFVLSLLLAAGGTDDLSVPRVAAPAAGAQLPAPPAPPIRDNDDGVVTAAAAAAVGGATVAEILRSLRLTQYSALFQQEGYEFVSDLLDAEEEDVAQLVSTMKKPERKRLRKALVRMSSGLPLVSTTATTLAPPSSRSSPLLSPLQPPPVPLPPLGDGENKATTRMHGDGKLPVVAAVLSCHL